MMRHHEANGVDTASPHVSRGGGQFLKRLREGKHKAKRVCFYFHSSKPFNTGGVDGTRTRDPRRDRPVF
jgi:hypothetical protein